MGDIAELQVNSQKLIAYTGPDRVKEMVLKAQAIKNREQDLIYIEADKYLAELEVYICKSFECNRRFRKDYQWAMKRRLDWGPEAVLMINELTREMIRPGQI